LYPIFLVKDGSFRSQEAIPPETVMFFPWGMKPTKNETDEVRQKLSSILNEKMQFGGLEGLGRGWSDLHTINAKSEK
jgi:CRISPR-associated protein Cmr4